MFKKKVKEECHPIPTKIYYMITRCELCGTRYEKVCDWGMQRTEQKCYCGNGNIGWRRLVGFVDEDNWEDYLKENNIDER